MVYWSGHRGSNPGLNLGKVVRYQLRHVRIISMFGPSGRIRTGKMLFHEHPTYLDYPARHCAHDGVEINVPPLINGSWVWYLHPDSNREYTFVALRSERSDFTNLSMEA